MTTRMLALPFAAISAIAATGAFAQNPPAKPDAGAANEAQRVVTFLDRKALDESVFEFSYSSPNSPVLPLIGVEGDQITRVDSLRTFGFGVINGFGSGSASPAYAIDFSPYALLASKEANIFQYRNASALSRIAARTKVAIAISQGDKVAARPSSLVVSFATKLLDGSDTLARTDFDRCIIDGTLGHMMSEISDAANQRLADQAIPIGQAAAAKERFEAELVTAKQAEIDQAYSDCASAHAKAIAASSSLDIGAGFRLRGDPGSIGNLKGSGGIVWATWASGIIGSSRAGVGDSGGMPGLTIRAVAHARYSFSQSIYDDKFLFQGKRDALMIAAGIESAPVPDADEKLRWSLQGGWNKQNKVLPTEEDKSYWRLLAELDLRLLDGMWLTATLGHARGRGIKTDTKALFGFTFTPPGRHSQVASFFGTKK